MVIDDLKKSIDAWMQSLTAYEFSALCVKPSPEQWSLGQVYMHLIENTDYFIEQAKICAAISENASEESSSEAKAMFKDNCFPNAQLEGPPENAFTPQPESKEQLINDLFRIKSDADALHVLITRSAPKGKTKHPGLNYFSATEWIQFADMHLRHHLRQKQRLETFLKRVGANIPSVK